MSSSPVPLLSTDRTRIAADTNLSVLRRQDPQIQSIQKSSSHVAVYELPPTQDPSAEPQWRRMDIEGSLFIVRRAIQPYYRIVVINRKSPENYQDDIWPGEMELEMAEQMIMYKNRGEEIRGIWFWEEREMKEILEFVKGLVEGKQEGGGAGGPDGAELPQPSRIGVGTQKEGTIGSLVQTQTQDRNAMSTQAAIRQTSAPNAVASPPQSQSYGPVYPPYPTKAADSYQTSALRPPANQHLQQPQQQGENPSSLERFFPGLSIASPPTVPQQQQQQYYVMPRPNSQPHQHHYNQASPQQQQVPVNMSGSSSPPASSACNPAATNPNVQAHPPASTRVVPPPNQVQGGNSQQNGGAMIMNLLGQGSRNISDAGAPPTRYGNATARVNETPARTMRNQSNKGHNIKEEARKVGEAVGSVGSRNRGGKLTKGEFRTIVQRLLTDRNLFHEVYEQYKTGAQT